MGYLDNGRWKDEWYDTASSGGRFRRSTSRFRHWVTADGAAGPSGEGGFRAEPDRYHLYVSLACPWAHRTLIFRALLGLEEVIPLSVVHWRMAEHGWSFEPGPGVIGDPVLGASYLHQIYTRADPHCSGRVTVPLLWDRERDTIANNESAEIIRMFQSAFAGLGRRRGNYLPDELRAEIDSLNDWLYDTVNNGVYKCGFATTQAAYAEAMGPLFASLDALEQRLAQQRYLLGERITEADWRLFTTLVRFDAVYVGHFKCNLRRLVDYPNLHGYVCDLYQQPGIAATVDFDHIKRHYYESHHTINPTGIVPLGPLLDFSAPHGRGPAAEGAAS